MIGVYDVMSGLFSITSNSSTCYVKFPYTKQRIRNKRRMQNMTLAIGPGTPASNVLSDNVLNVGDSGNSSSSSFSEHSLEEEDEEDDDEEEGEQDNGDDEDLLHLESDQFDDDNDDDEVSESNEDNRTVMA